MMSTLVLPPFVATAIVEHAKRRHHAAGYLIGSRSGNQVTITDYIPCTHESTADVRSRTYTDELSERVALKRTFTPNAMLIGWYAAGSPEPGNERAFDLWCQAPGASFSKIRSNNQAAMLLACMPTQKNMSVRWDAYITSNVKVGDVFNCERTQQLSVSVEAETQLMNVLLVEMTSKALYNGGLPYATNRITNLDRVAADAAARDAEIGRRDNNNNNNKRDGDTRSVEEALLSVQNKLKQAISHAHAVMSSGNKGRNESQKEIEALVADHKTILKEKSQQGSRDDFISESYKDALMIKYTAALLRRHIMEIERHSRHEPKEKPQQGHAASPHTQRKVAAFR